MVKNKKRSTLLMEKSTLFSNRGMRLYNSRPMQRIVDKTERMISITNALIIAFLIKGEHKLPPLLLGNIHTDGQGCRIGIGIGLRSRRIGTGARDFRIKHRTPNNDGPSQWTICKTDTCSGTNTGQGNNAQRNH